MDTSTDQLRVQGRVRAASLLVRVAAVIAPARMEWWVGTPFANWLRRLAQKITR